MLPYLTKGQLVGVSGELCLREYESKGVKGSSLEVNVNSLTLLGNKSVNETKADKPMPQGNGPMDDMADDIPFASCSVAHDIESRLSRRMKRYD